MTDFTRRQLRHLLNWGNSREKRLALQLLDSMLHLKLAKQFNLEYENEREHGIGRSSRVA